MRALAGFGIIGLLVVGGYWVKGELFGTDAAICEDLNGVRIAILTGDSTYEQETFDFEAKQVRDEDLAEHVGRLFTQRAEERKPSRIEVTVMMTEFVQALERCEELEHI